MARILWLGDAGAHTGFAKVTEQIGNRLVTEYGHDIHCLAVNYRGDYWPTALKLYVPTLMDRSDVYGTSRFVEMIAEVLPEVVVMVNDPAILLGFLANNPFDTEHVLLKQNLLAYIPIDGYDMPPAWDILGQVTTRVAMSKFGQAAMKDSSLIYHGVDTDVFYPEDKKESKRKLGFDPNRFLVLRVDSNSWRKNYADSWRALRPVLRKFKDIDVHFHCRANGQPNGVDLKAFISGDDDIRDRVTFSPNLGGFTGWGEETMRTLYSAADVFLSTSMGEGFGLTIAEAMACGTPVIAQNVSAITEVVGPGGILIDPERPFATGMGHDQMLPNVSAFTQELEHLYLAGGTRRKLGEAARTHVERSFSWDVAADGFNSLITQLVTQASDAQEVPV